MAYTQLGKFDEAYFSFKRYEKLAPRDGRKYRNWAMYYALQGRKDVALVYIRRAINSGYDDYTWLKNDPSMDSLRNEKEFIKIINDLSDSKARTE